MRLGIFGGSFDPPHLGHLLPLLDAADLLHLDRVLFVPAATQPFKVGRAVASAEHRAAMTERLVAQVPGFAVSRVEVQRAGLSFTVDTLAGLSAEHPGAELTLLLGADAAELLDQWRAPDRIRQLARLVALVRGSDGPRAASTPAGIELLQTRRVDISSTELRVRVADGRTIRGFVPDAVADYIAEHRLYR